MGNHAWRAAEPYREPTASDWKAVFFMSYYKEGREPIDRKFKKREPEDPKTGESVYSADSPVCIYGVSYSHFTGSIRDARVCVNNL